MRGVRCLQERPGHRGPRGLEQALKGQEGGGPQELSVQALPQVLLQVLIIITGNYNFFNLLTLVLTTALLDDGHLTATPGNGHCKKTASCECQLVPDGQTLSAQPPTSKFLSLHHPPSDPCSSSAPAQD